MHLSHGNTKWDHFPGSRYFPFIERQLSPMLEALVRDQFAHPAEGKGLCQQWALNHCLYQNKGRANWTIMLRGVDKYLARDI